MSIFDAVLTVRFRRMQGARLAAAAALLAALAGPGSAQILWDGPALMSPVAPAAGTPPW